MKTDLFQSCGHCRVFQICWHIECSTFTASPFRIWNSSTGNPKQALTKASALRLPDPEKAFQLYVHKKEGIALGSVNSKYGTWAPDCSLFSKRLDPTTRGWPPCLRNLAAIAILIEDALKFSFGGKLTIFTSQVKQLLNGRGHLLMSDQRTLRYQVVLPGLTISPCEVLKSSHPPAYPWRLSPFTLA